MALYMKTLSPSLREQHQQHKKLFPDAKATFPGQPRVCSPLQTRWRRRRRPTDPKQPRLVCLYSSFFLSLSLFLYSSSYYVPSSGRSSAICYLARHSFLPVNHGGKIQMLQRKGSPSATSCYRDVIEILPVGFPRGKDQLELPDTHLSVWILPFALFIS